MNQQSIDERASQLAAGDERRSQADERLLAELDADRRQADELLQLESERNG